MKRVVSQLTLHPSVDVKRIRDASGGSRRYGSRAGGRLREVILNGSRFIRIFLEILVQIEAIRKKRKD